MKLNKKIIVALVVILISAISVFTTAFFIKAEMEKDEKNDESCYMMSSAASSYLNVSQSPNSSGAGALKKLKISDAGGLLAYIDDATPNFINYLSSTITVASTSMSYKALLNMKTSKKEDGGYNQTNAVYYYCRFGYLIKAIGFDDTCTSQMFSFRSIAGSILWLFYALSQVIPMLFKVAIAVLKQFNPFTLFGRGYNAVFVNSTMKMEMVGEANPFYYISVWIGNMYQEMYKWSWDIVVPFSLAFILAGLFITQRMDKFKSSTKKLVIKVLMIAFGVPI